MLACRSGTQTRAGGAVAGGVLGGQKTPVSTGSRKATAMPRSSILHRLAAHGAPLVLALVATPLSAQSISLAGSGQRFPTLQAAVDAIGNGQGTIILAPGTYNQCAVQTAGRITLRAADPGTAILDRTTCEGKAALVLRGGGATIDGLVFQNMHVPDLNGAGIRLEQGDLAVVNCLFRSSDEGILGAADPASSVSIDRSTFSRLGRNDGGPSHSLYIGDYGSLSVTRSRFERGTGGHYIKSRAARATITDNMFDDSQGSATNYMIDLPAGAVGRISGNVFIQGENKENYSAFIAVSAEGREHPSAGLVIEGNSARLATGVSRQTVFVADWSGARLALGRNTLGPDLTPYERR